MEDDDTQNGTRARVLPLVAEPLTREERIFSLYGLLTVVYVVVASWFAVQFWQRWLWGTITNLWEIGGWLNRAAAAALVLLVVAPIVFGLVFVALGAVRSAVGWLIRNGYGRKPGLIAAISSAVVLALALVLSGETVPWYAQALPLVLWTVAAVALMIVRPDYRGAAIAPALAALVPATLLAGIASLVRVLLPDVWLWQAIDGMAMLFLLIAAFTAQLEVSVRHAPPHVQLATALMLMLSFGVGGLVLIGQLTTAMLVASLPTAALLAQAAPVAMLVAAPAYFGAVALALMLPYMFSLTDSRLVWSWVLLWGAALAQTAAYMVDLNAPSLGLDVLSSGLWAAAFISHLATLRQIAPTELPWEHVAHLTERQRLERAFQLCYAGCYRLLRAVYGARRTRELDDRMDVVAATANWDVRLDREMAEVGLRLAALPLNAQGARFAEVLRYTVATIEDLAGASFARRTIQAAYDALPWPERETAGRLCFPDTPWARELSGAFGDIQEARLRLLREVDMLLTCDDAEMAALGRAAQEWHVRAGERLLRAGSAVPGLWIIEAGEILAKQGTSIVRELHRAGTFGFEEAMSDTSTEHTYQASVDSTLLFIPAAELRSLVREAAPHAADATESAATLRLLERVPMFAKLPRSTLRELAHVATTRQFQPRELIIRQGTLSGTFYIIKQGRAAVLTRTGGEKSTIRVVARLGPEEFFGESELIDRMPPRAHVIAETATSVLALPLDSVRMIALGNSEAAKGLEQISSSRMLALRGS